MTTLIVFLYVLALSLPCAIVYYLGDRHFNKPKYKVGDILQMGGNEEWETPIRIEILGIGKRNYKTKFVNSSFVNSTPFHVVHSIYKKVN